MNLETAVSSLKSQRFWGWISLCFLVMIALRILAAWVIPPGADEVLFLYLAEDIAEGTRFPVYILDQHLIGPLPSYFLAPLLKVFEWPFWGVRLYHMAFYLIFVGLYLRMIQRLFGEELKTYTLLLLSVLPYPILFFTTVIGWIDLLPLAILNLSFLLRLSDPQERSSALAFFGGIVSGVLLWRNPLSVIWLIPLGISLIWMIPRTWERKIPWIYLGGFLVGLLPVWINGLQTGILMSAAGHGGGPQQDGADLIKVFYLFFARLKYFLFTFVSQDTFPGWGVLSRVLSLIPFGIFVFSFASIVMRFLRAAKTFPAQERIFCLFTVLPPLLLVPLYCSRDFLTSDEGMRFFIPFVIPYVFSVGWWVRSFASPFWKRGVLGLLVFILLVGHGLPMQRAFVRLQELQKLSQFLQERGLHYGIADFPTAYPVNVLSHHKLFVTPLWGQADNREIFEKVKTAGPRFLVLDRSSSQFRYRLSRDRRLARASVASYDIFYGDSLFLKRLLATESSAIF